MKKTMSAIIVISMILTVFAGVVFFNASADTKSNQEIASISSAPLDGTFDSTDVVATFGAVADSEVVKNDGTVKLLMIGNSFSWNAYEFINQIAAAEGADFVCANLNYGGCSLQQHADFMTNNKEVYGYQRSWGSTISNYTASQALADQDWDYISIQQVSGKAGRPETYQPYMHTVIEYIKKRCPHAEIIWHQTWAYQKTSDHSDFPYFNNDQDYMWQCIESTSKAKTAEEGIRYIVPSGKAFQNARATSIGDNLNTDGYHANAMGQYLAGFCFFSTVTGILPSTSSYRPSSISEADCKLLRKAITDAVNEYGYVTYTEDTKFIPALNHMKNASVSGTLDALMVAGNLVKNSTDDFTSFKSIYADYIGNTNVIATISEGDRAIIPNPGLIFTSTMKEYYANDLEPSAQKRKGNRHIRVNGIDIFGITYDKLTDGFATYTDASLEWLDSELAALKTDMPILILTSFPVSHTIGSPGASRICDVLKKYEHVIVFSGGTHEGVANDLIVHHDGFTAVNVGSLSDETANGLMVEVDRGGNVRIHRYDFISGEEYTAITINANGIGLDAYAAGYYAAPVINLEDGAEFDAAGEAPVMTWLQDGEKATLDGEPCEYGTEVTAPGEHTLVVTAGDKSSSVTFTIIDSTPEPVVSIADGAEFDLYTADGPIAATWTPEEATATLNENDYAAGTAITEVGVYTLVVTNGSKSVTVNFTVIDTTPAVKPGDMDGDGEITVADALKTLRIAAHLLEPTQEDLAIGDVDGDGEITVADALKILRVAAKLASEDTL